MTKLEEIMNKYYKVKDLIMDPDLSSFAFKAKRDFYDKKRIVVQDGMESRPYDNVDFLYFKPIGLVFRAMENGEDFFVINGKEESRFFKVCDFISKQNSYAYVGITVNWERVVVKDGKKSNLYNQVSDLTLSPDGKSVAFVAVKDGKVIVVKDFVVIGEYDFACNIKYSPNGNIGYKAMRNGKRIIAIDGRESDEYEDVSKIIFPENGEGYTFFAKKDGKWIVVRNGEEGKTQYDRIYDFKLPIYSPDGQSFVFVGVINDEHFVEKDGVKKGPYDFVFNLEYFLGDFIAEVQKSGKTLKCKII